jgi:hypothetical protein
MRWWRSASQSAVWKADATPLRSQRLCRQAGAVLGQRATRRNLFEDRHSQLLATLLEAASSHRRHGHQANSPKPSRARHPVGQDNQPKLADSIRDFTRSSNQPAKRHMTSPRRWKDHGRIEVTDLALSQLDCLHKPEQWPDLTSFIVIESGARSGKKQHRATALHQQRP